MVGKHSGIQKMNLNSFFFIRNAQAMERTRTRTDMKNKLKKRKNGEMERK